MARNNVYVFVANKIPALRNFVKGLTTRSIKQYAQHSVLRTFAILRDPNSIWCLQRGSGLSVPCKTSSWTFAPRIFLPGDEYLNMKNSLTLILTGRTF